MALDLPLAPNLDELLEEVVARLLGPATRMFSEHGKGNGEDGDESMKSHAPAAWFHLNRALH